MKFTNHLNLSNLKTIIKNKKKIFLITGKVSFKKSRAQKLLKRFIPFENIHIYYKKTSYPEITELNKIIKEINKFKPDLLIGIGGGAVLDYTKLASTLYASDIKNIIKTGKYEKINKIHCLCIPTTAGSGSEMTKFAVLYVKKKKFSLEHKKIKPNYFYTNPSLIINLPKINRASSGFDAIAQCLESLISKSSNKLSVRYSLKGFEISFKHFSKFVQSPNLYNCKKMTIAASYSGAAINIAKTNTPHAVSYPFTSHFNIIHGNAVAINFLKIYKYFYETILKKKNSILLKRFERLLVITNSKNFDEFIIKLKILINKSKMKTNYKELNININKQINIILNNVNFQRLNNSPIILKRSELKNLIVND